MIVIHGEDNQVRRQKIDTDARALTLHGNWTFGTAGGVALAEVIAKIAYDFEPRELSSRPRWRWCLRRNGARRVFRTAIHNDTAVYEASPPLSRLRPNAAEPSLACSRGSCEGLLPVRPRSRVRA